MAEVFGGDTLFGAMYETIEEDFDDEPLEGIEYLAVGGILALIWLTLSILACVLCFLWPAIFMAFIFGLLLKKKRRK